MPEAFNIPADLLERMQHISFHQQRDFVIGMKAHSGSFYANCAGVEFDGSTAAKAAEAVCDEIVTRMKHQLREAETDVKKISSMLQFIEK